jgi:hypothetical protein
MPRSHLKGTSFFFSRGLFWGSTCRQSSGVRIVYRLDNNVFPHVLISTLVELQIDQLSEIEWNKEAFTSLVVDEPVKELITALVTNQLSSERSTDLMDGKGNGQSPFFFYSKPYANSILHQGLIILLHGYVSKPSITL